MNILLVAATSKEIASFLEDYRNNSGKDIDILVAGIGLTATAFSLARQFHIKRPDLVIQAGIAGSLDEQIPPGTVVAVKQDLIADQGVVEKRKLMTLFDMKLVSPNQFPYKNGWLMNDTPLLKIAGLKKVKAISINQVSTSKQMIRLYREKYKAVTESMEGAAFHYASLLEKIPFLQIRAISNMVGERNKKKWNFAGAILNLNNELLRIINEL